MCLAVDVQWKMSSVASLGFPCLIISYQGIFHFIFFCILFIYFPFYPSGPLCVHYVFQFSVFMVFLSVQMNPGSLFVVPSLWIFSFCLYVLFFSDVLVSILYILLYYNYIIL